MLDPEDMDPEETERRAEAGSTDMIALESIMDDCYEIETEIMVHGYGMRKRASL